MNIKTLADVLAAVSWGGDEYPTYAGEGKSAPSPAESGAMGNAKTFGTDAGTNAADQNSTLSQVEGADVTKTPMYKRLLSLASEGTANAYNAARGKRSAAANAAGFGYNSPIAQTDKATTNYMEARDVGNLPREVAQDVMPYSMGAAQMRGQNIGTYVRGSNDATSTWGQLEQARKQRQMQMWGGISGLAVKGAQMGMAASGIPVAGV